MWIFKLLGTLPIWILYPFGYLLSLLARRVYRRKEVLENLRMAFPEKSEKELIKIRSQFYKNLMQIVMEVIKTTTWSEAEMRKRTKLVNPEIIEDVYKQGGSVIIFASHCANWEWIAHAITLYTSFKLDPIYKVQANKLLDGFVHYVRARFGGTPIPKENAVRNVLKGKDRQRAIGFVADQRPFERGAKVWINFMGRETAFYPGNVALPYVTQFPCFYLKATRIKPGYYECEAIPLGNPPIPKKDASVLKNYAAEIEKQIQEYPADWLWSHKRWKYQRTSDEELLT